MPAERCRCIQCRTGEYTLIDGFQCLVELTYSDEAADDLRHAVHGEPHGRPKWLFRSVVVSMSCGLSNAPSNKPFVKHCGQQHKAWTDPGFQGTKEETSCHETGEIITSGHAQKNCAPKTSSCCKLPISKFRGGLTHMMTPQTLVMFSFWNRAFMGNSATR